METPYRAGFNRGSADKLAGRPYDKSTPPAHSSDSKGYRKGYRKGYKTTDTVGASFSASYGGSATVSIGPSGSSSPTSSSSAPSGGTLSLLKGGVVSSLLASRGAWTVAPVAIWQDPSKGAREGMLVRMLRQAGSSGKPLLVSFFLRRNSNLSAKALGSDELLAYGIVQSVSGDGYDGRRYETKITSYGRYTPTGPAEGTAPADAPAIGTVFVLGSNDLASMAEYDAPAEQGFQAILPETAPSASSPVKPKWTDIIAALNNLDGKIAAIEAAIETKDVTAWGPKYDAFVRPWRGVAAKIRTARTIPNEYSDPFKAEAAIMAARATFAKLYDEWNTLKLKPKPKTEVKDIQKKEDAKTPFSEEKKVEEKKEDLPPKPDVLVTRDLVVKDGGEVVRDLEKRDLPLTTSQPSWFEENWKYLAVGGLLLAGGGYLYMRQRSV